MASVVRYSAEFYISHLPLLLLFSLAFAIAFLIPFFASFPTYNDAGGIFLRLASTFINLNAFTAAVIVFSTLFSLLFLSFAIVAINLIVKHSRMHTKIRREVLDGLERYTTKVFIVLLLFTAIMALVSIATYVLGISPIIASVIGLIVTPFFFYAPAAIVIDERNIMRSFMLSARFFVHKLQYPLLWLAIAIILLSVLDFVFIAATGTTISRYLLLVANSFFILPFLVVLQSQAYMRRFPLLKL